jgi:hypothetical protein
MPYAFLGINGRYGHPAPRPRNGTLVSGPVGPSGPGATISVERETAVLRDSRHMIAVKRVTLAAATAFLAINLWTGAPLIALWVGSQVEGETSLTMRALLAVVGVLAVLIVAMTLALTWLSNTYDALIGRPQDERHKPWLRSVRAEGEIELESRVGVTALERIVMMSVYIAVISLLIWLVFFAGSFVPPQFKA